MVQAQRVTAGAGMMVQLLFSTILVLSFVSCLGGESAALSSPPTAAGEEKMSAAASAEVARWLHALEVLDPPADEAPPSLMLVTAQGRTGHGDHCQTTQGSHLLTRSYKNKVDYCSLHGCSVRYVLEDWPSPAADAQTPRPEADGGGPSASSLWWIRRLDAILRLMRAHPSAEWMLWMDGEAMFTNFSFSLPLQSYTAWGKHLVIPAGTQSKLKMKAYGKTSKDWIPLSTPVFLLRNSPWSRDFLNKWRKSGISMVPNEAQEEIGTIVNNEMSSLLELLTKVKNENQEGKILIEDGYSSFGLGDFIVKHFTTIMVDGVEAKKWNWPFVVHFEGCNFCSKESISEICLSSFQRAFHFADNQLLALVGLQHQHLYTTLAQPFTIDT